MAPPKWLSRVGSVLGAEVAAIRRGDVDLDPRDLTRFTVPLLLRLIAVLAIGMVPLVVIRNGAEANSVLVPVLGSVALASIGTAVAAWLFAIAISGVVVVVFYRTGPRAASQLVLRTVADSFNRAQDLTGRLAQLALVAGLIALAIGLPSRPHDVQGNPILEDLLTAQVAVLLGVLGVAFLIECVRCAAEIVGGQSLLLAWPWALLIACFSWILATTVGPFETVRLLTILLTEWLPADVEGRPRAEVIAELLPNAVHWWAALAPLLVIIVIWVIEAWRLDGFTHVREFIARLEGVDAG